MSRMGALIGVLLSVAMTAADEVELAPAELYRPRDGMGNVLAKLKAGEHVRIAYLGGSITAQQGWRPKTLKWFQERYPDAQVEEINAAIGGTPSGLGVYRLQQDVLSHDPDLVFVEFSVNDGAMQPDAIYRAMEGIVRQIWRRDPTIDICFVYTFRVGYEKDLDRGLCPRAPSVHEKIADHYGIPSINMALRIAALARAGKLIFKPAGGQAAVPEGAILFSKDGVHPLDAGHEIYREVIAAAIEAMEPTARPGPHKLVDPLLVDNWEDAKLVPLEPEMLSGEWAVLDPNEPGRGQRFHNRMPQVWHTDQPGSAITFKFTGTAVKLYDLLGPNGGQVMVTIDGKTSGPRPRFDSYCTYHRLAVLQIADGLQDTVHTVRVELDSEQPDRSPVAFRLKDPETELKSPKYQGTNLWVGSIMLIGEIVEE